MEIYKFKKDFKQRCDEYKNILLDNSGDQVERVWKSYLSPFLETTGWDAEWCIPSKMCKYLNILFPEYVLVTVINVDFETLTATIEIKQDIGVCDLPDEISEVALIDLIPLVKQNDQLSLPYMDLTASYLDQYRVFYKHLWWPWDEEDQSSPWVVSYLQDRLQLYYELMEGRISFETGTIINDLIVEGKAKYEQMLELTSDFHGEHPNEVLTYMNLSADLDALKKKLVFYSSEEIRRKLEICNRNKITHDWEHCLVIKSGTSCEQSLKVLTAASKKISENCPLNLSSNLDEAIKILFTGNTLLVGPGNHSLASVGILELGGELSGICLSNDTLPTLEDTGYERSSWLQFSLNQSKLSNVNLKVNHKFGITVLKNAKLELNNVKMSGSNREFGLNLKSESEIIAKNCQFENMNVVFRAMSGTNVVLENCKFKNNASVIRCLNNVTVTIVNCTVTNCSSSAIVWRKKSSNTINGSIECLKDAKEFNIENCKFENNKHDVQIISNNQN